MALNDGARPGAHQFLAFIHPGCGLCVKALPALRWLLTNASTRLEVFVAIAPMTRDSEKDVRLCALLVANGLATNGHTMLDSFELAASRLSLAREERWDQLQSELRIDPTADRTLTAEARGVVDCAMQKQRDAGTGTPAYFLDGVPVEIDELLAWSAP